MAYMVRCPTCEAGHLERCHDPERGFPRWLPHLRRVAVAVARVLLRAALDGGTLQFAQAVADADPGRSARRAQADSRASRLGDVDELVGYVSARYLLRLADAVMEEIDQRTLDLADHRGRAQALADELAQAHRAARMLHDGLTPPTTDIPVLGSPTPEQAMVWQELRELEAIRGHAARRDEAAARRFPGHEPAPWAVSPASPDGYFTARASDDRVVYGWAEAPETVPDILRTWSVPSGTTTVVTWTEEAEPPGRRRPFVGWPATVRPHHTKLWKAEPRRSLDAFAQALEELRASWPDGDLEDRLAAAAARLNAEEPQAPSLGDLACGSTWDGNIVLGRTQAAEWVSPGTIAFTGTPQWNNFGSHRPRQVAAIAAGLVHGDPAEQAALLAFPPISLVRIPGPAGPLYEIHSNGMHRIHAARLLGFPLLWAITDQYALPTAITWYRNANDGERLTKQAKKDILACWRGALDKGLADGKLDEAAGTLHPTWALAPWLLARPDCAVAWASNYDRAYPGSLPTLGIPRDALQSAEHWRSWLGGPA